MTAAQTMAGCKRAVGLVSLCGEQASPDKIKSAKNNCASAAHVSGVAALLLPHEPDPAVC